MPAVITIVVVWRIGAGRFDVAGPWPGKIRSTWAERMPITPKAMQRLRMKPMDPQNPFVR